MRNELESENKVTSLKEAISAHVHPGMKLNLCGGIGGPSAAICEIIRQFQGTDPGFELIQSTITGHAANLIHCRLVKKIVFTAFMQIAASGHPSKVAQRACAEQQIEFENWSLLSLQQRLMAGAMGLAFMPTRSILGSTLAQELAGNCVEIDDPFHGGEKVGIVRALRPDLTIMHACAADQEGNLITAAPAGDDIWGPRASIQGVIATVDHIIDSVDASKYAPLVTIPGYLVKAVCLASRGLHPFSLVHPTLDFFTPYETDATFLVDLHRASQRPDLLNEWIHEWILDCAVHEQYLEKVDAWHAKKRPSASIPDHPKSSLPSSTMTALGCTNGELLKIIAAREIVRSVIENQYRTLLVGAGAMALAARLAYFQLLNQEYRIQLITGNGQVGYTPDPKGASLQSINVVATSTMLTDTITTHGVLVGGGNSRCLSVLGAGQVDRFGNINSSRTSDGDFLVGTGGANDAANANEVILIVPHKSDRLVESLPYVTAPGGKVTKLITGKAIFTKSAGHGELVLTSCFPGDPAQSIAELIDEIEKTCGWKITPAADIDCQPPPTTEELLLLRSFGA